MIAYNAIILGIYGYTYWQERKTNQRIASLQENIINEQATQQEQFIQEEIKNNEKYLQNQQEIIKNLEEIVKNPLTSSLNIDGLETKYPGIKIEYNRIKNWFKNLIPKEKKDQENNLLAEFTAILATGELTNEQKNILLSLNLTDQQIIAISQQSPKLKDKNIILNYSLLNTTQKLQALELGLNALGLKENKRDLANIRQQILTEKKTFDLTIQEKENILRLFIDNLALTSQQKQELEKMGITFLDASNWKITPEQKQNLLKVGLEKIQLNDEQKQRLFTTNLQTYQLSPFHKNIINTLSPLAKEYKHSEQLLVEIKKLNLNNDSINFLVNEEIIPNLYNDFGKSTVPYLSLKINFLTSQQKHLERELLIQQKIISQKKIIELRQSLLPTLWEFGKKNQGKLFDLNLHLNHEYFKDKEDWVSIKAINDQQRNLLFINEFKLIPKYNYFELLIFAVRTQGKIPADYLLNTELETDWNNYLTSLSSKKTEIDQEVWAKYIAPSTNKLATTSSQFAELEVSLLKEAVKEFITEQEEISHNEEKQTEEPITETVAENDTNNETSPYDELLTNLSAEEIEWEKKKQLREEARKNLEEAEIKRRQEKLSEKDRKLQEEEERRKQEKELEIQEQERKRKAEEARNQQLKEQQAAYLSEKLRQIEEKKKRTEESLATKKQESELEEQRKKKIFS